MKDLTVVIPVYKEDPQVVMKLHDELVSYGANVIIVDDGDTVELPEDINEMSYKPNRGYGFAIMHGIRNSITPIVAICDGDGQHTAIDIWRLYSAYQIMGKCKMIVGTRWDLSEVWYRAFARKCINFFASIFVGHYLTDLNSGLRIMDRNMVMGYLPILCPTFSFTTSLTMSVVTDNHRFAYLPVDVLPRANGKSHVKLLRDGLKTLYYIVVIGCALRTRKLRQMLRRIVGR